MSIWAIGDLHLSFGVPDKQMGIFGANWENHADVIKKNWEKSVQPEDLVLIPGDISWAMRVEEAKPDLQWIDALPGTKVMIRGNHDYWWTSLKKVEGILPPSLHVIQNNSYTWKNVSIAGARLWDTAEYAFGDYIEIKPNSKAKKLTEQSSEEDSEKIFERELGRLEASLKSMSDKAQFRIAMTHYPPISATLQDSRASQLLEKYKVDVCVFGHLHNMKPDPALFGIKNGIKYHLVSCDFLHFKTLLIRHLA